MVIVLEFLFRSYISKKFCGITVEETVVSKLRVRATYTHSPFSFAICLMPGASERDADAYTDVPRVEYRRGK